MAHAGQVLVHPGNGERMEFVRTASDTEGEVLEVIISYMPGSDQPPAHLHPHQEERFEVLEGEVSVVLAGQRRLLRRGDALHVPVGAVHKVGGAGDVPSRMRWETRPALKTEQLFEAFTALAEGGGMKGGKPHPLQGAVLGEHFSDVFRLAKPPWAIQRPLIALLARIGRRRGYGIPTAAAQPTAERLSAGAD